MRIRFREVHHEEEEKVPFKMSAEVAKKYDELMGDTVLINCSAQTSEMLTEEELKRKYDVLMGDL